MNLLKQINLVLTKTFKQLGYPTDRAFASKANRDGYDFQCNAAMAIAKQLGTNSKDLAKEIAEALEQHESIDRVEVSGNGFINIVVSNYLLEQALRGNRVDSKPYDIDPKNIIIDFGGPNIAKPLHVGHLRSLVIGESLRRILQEVGHNVTSDIHYGDWGLQMGQLISYLIKHVTISEMGHAKIEDIESWYASAAKECREDPERMEAARASTVKLQAGDEEHMRIWRYLRTASLSDQTSMITALRVHFDLWLGESSVNNDLEPLCFRAISEGIAEYSDGALVIPVAEPTDRTELPPLILRKSDGAALYGTTDLATIEQRVHDHEPLDRILYVVDQRQATHFQQVFRAAKKLGVQQELVHVGFGTVNDAQGKPFKSRDGSGQSIRLSQLLDDARRAAKAKIDPEIATPGRVEKIAMAAVKFGDLQTNRLSGYNFDLDKFLEFEGKTGPYLLYALVRIHSIIGKVEVHHNRSISKITTKEEHDLAVIGFGLNEAIAAAAEEYAPNRIAEYAFELAQAFSRFYANCPVLGVEDPSVLSARMSLLELTSTHLQNALYCLGIEYVDKM